MNDYTVSDRPFEGYRVLYVYQTYPRLNLHKGIDCIHAMNVLSGYLLGASILSLVCSGRR
jgi:hypothetical protein